MPPKKKTTKTKKPARAKQTATTEDAASAFIKEIPDRAEILRDMAKKVFGVKLDYSAKSIPKLDDIIKEGWPKKPPVMLDNMVTVFGSYLGEAIRRIHGGEWSFSDEHGLHLDVGGLDIKIFPFAKVQKRFLNGEEDSIGFYYSFIRSKVDETKRAE